MTGHDAGLAQNCRATFVKNIQPRILLTPSTSQTRTPRKSWRQPFPKREKPELPYQPPITEAGRRLLLLERMVAACSRRPTSSHGVKAQPLDAAQALELALADWPECWTAMEDVYPIIVDDECLRVCAPLLLLREPAFQLS